MSTVCLHYANKQWNCNKLRIVIKQLSRRYSDFSAVDVTGCHTVLSDHIKLLGVIFDKNLTVDNHIASVSNSVHYHIRALLHIHTFAPPSLKTWPQWLPWHWWVHASIHKLCPLQHYLEKHKFPAFGKLKISLCMLRLIPTNSIPTHFFGSFTGFLLNTGSPIKLLTLLSILYIIHSLHIYIPSCAFTLLLVH